MGKNTGRSAATDAHRAENTFERFGVVYIGWPVEGEDSVGAAAGTIPADAKPVENRRSSRPVRGAGTGSRS